MRAGLVRAFLNRIDPGLLDCPDSRQDREDKTDGHQKKASELLRMSYRAFRYHAEKLGLARDD